MSKEEQGTTKLLLPIVCPGCKKEIELAVTFELMPPKEQEEEDIIKETRVNESKQKTPETSEKSSS